MDIDISDILADISRPTPSSFSNHQQQPYDHYDAETAYTDHVLLTRAWTWERCTPTLLPYPTNLISRVMDRIRAQITKIEDLTSGVYEGASGPQTSGANLNLILSILQTDLSRTQFLMRSYLRQRLAKVTKHATYYLKHHVNNPDSQNPDTKSPLLSAEEIQYLRHHATLLSTLYNSSFLLSLPPSLRKLDDNTGGSRMDEGPDAAQGVMVRCLAAEWSNERDVFEAEEDIGGTQKEEERPTVELRVERGGVLIARWRDVRSGVEKGDLEVL